jgi:hypothetical protein
MLQDNTRGSQVSEHKFPATVSFVVTASYQCSKLSELRVAEYMTQRISEGAPLSRELLPGALVRKRRVNYAGLHQLFAAED